MTNLYISELDRECLPYVGGVENNSFINIKQTDTDDDEHHHQPEIIVNSPYYDTDDLITTFNAGKNKFSIFSTNIQTIKAKFDELKIFIEHIGTLGIEFSAICTQESTISEGDDLSQLQLKGYNLIPQSKSCSAEGGLIIYLDEIIKYDYKSKLNKYRSWEGQVIQLKKGENLNKPTNTVHIYRPPNDLLDSYNKFIKELSPVLSTLQNINNEVIVAGDFNINLLQINDRHIFGEYFDMLTSQFLPKNHTSHHISKQSCNTHR